MDTYLLKFGFCGIKNIKNDVELSFYKKGVGKNFDPSDYRIKSIYGENGSGKTAIMTAFSILKKLIAVSDYLSDSKTQELLQHIVNKESNSFKLYAEFYRDFNSIPLVLYYEILVEKNADTGLYEIQREVLRRKKATYARAQYQDLYIVERGKFLVLETADKEILLNETMNLLKKSSAITKLMDVYLHLLSKKKVDDLSIAVMIIQFTAIQMQAFLNHDDDHSLFYARKKIEKLREVNEITGEFIGNALNQINEAMSLQSNRVFKKSIHLYEKRIDSLAEFIRKFKPTLNKISIEKKELDEYYYLISLVFDYGTYTVDYEFESTGIKKLVHLYDAIWCVTHGGIVFIDEFDANINSVFFDRIIEYVRDYAEGQLCFTVHNTSSMDSLKDGKDSINFLTSGGQIIKWTKNGHYSPDVLYRKGMIDMFPFNIYGSDFVGIFEVDNE